MSRSEGRNASFRESKQSTMYKTWTKRRTKSCYRYAMRWRVSPHAHIRINIVYFPYFRRAAWALCVFVCMRMQNGSYVRYCWMRMNIGKYNGAAPTRSDRAILIHSVLRTRHAKNEKYLRVDGVDTITPPGEGIKHYQKTCVPVRPYMQNDTQNIKNNTPTPTHTHQNTKCIIHTHTRLMLIEN